MSQPPFQSTELGKNPLASYDEIMTHLQRTILSIKHLKLCI